MPMMCSMGPMMPTKRAPGRWERTAIMGIMGKPGGNGQCTPRNAAPGRVFGAKHPKRLGPAQAHGPAWTGSGARPAAKTFPCSFLLLPQGRRRRGRRRIARPGGARSGGARPGGARPGGAEASFPGPSWRACLAPRPPGPRPLFGRRNAQGGRLPDSGDSDGPCGPAGSIRSPVW